MNPSHIVNELLDGQDWPRQLIGEASVHRPRRGQIWVASFTGVAGQQWRTTGTADRAAAWARAKEFEAAARVQRAHADRTAKQPALTLRAPPGDAGGGLTQREVAWLLRISERAVRAIEKRALRKLAHHSGLRELWRQFLAGELTEQGPRFSPWELQALWGLTRSRAERDALRKALERVPTGPDRSRPARRSLPERYRTARRVNFQNESKPSPAQPEDGK